MAGWISVEQQRRDHNGLRDVCCACGHDGTRRNPLQVNERGMRVHSDAYHDRMRQTAIEKAKT